jgi:AraC-like DNA-binding protein
MEYQEFAPPPALAGWIAARWTLDCGQAAGATIMHRAAPDGCIELIHRTHGTSTWRSAQPPVFATGLSEAPAGLTLSGNARFIGLRLWPWAWNRISAVLAHDFADGWIDAAPLTALVAAPSFDAIARCFAEPPPLLARATLAAVSVGELAAASRCTTRTVQRWFAREVGLTPQRYLRLLRFRAAVSQLHEADTSLADHAMATGYADQAHMARDFRNLAGATASAARQSAVGPFLPDAPR